MGDFDDRKLEREGTNSSLAGNQSLNLVVPSVRATSVSVSNEELDSTLGTDDMGKRVREELKSSANKDMNIRSVDYCERALLGGESVPFPDPPPAKELRSMDDLVKHEISYLERINADMPRAAIVRAAWALVVGQITDSKDVIFGIKTTESTAQTAIKGGSVLSDAILPMRFQLHKAMNVLEYLEATHNQAINMALFESNHPEKVARICEEMQLQTLIYEKVNGNGITDGDELLLKSEAVSENQWSKDFGLVLEVQYDDQRATMTAHFNSKEINTWMITNLLRQTETAFQKLCQASMKETISNINLLSDKEAEEIWKWNATVPEPIDSCVHDRIREQAILLPDRSAVHAWDGKLTYGQLENFATSLASHLIKVGVKPGNFVLLCFEKSMWTTVGILGPSRLGQPLS